MRAFFTERTIQDEGPASLLAPVIRVRTRSCMPEARAPELKAVMTRSTGYDHVLACRRATVLAVPAAHLPLYSSRAVAGRAMLLWTALLRKLMPQLAAFRTFEPHHLTGCGVQRRTLAAFGSRRSRWSNTCISGQMGVFSTPVPG